MSKLKKCVRYILSLRFYFQRNLAKSRRVEAKMKKKESGRTS